MFPAGLTIPVATAAQFRARAFAVQLFFLGRFTLEQIE
jgi:hypothetical protein